MSAKEPSPPTDMSFAEKLAMSQRIDRRLRWRYHRYVVELYPVSEAEKANRPVPEETPSVEASPRTGRLARLLKGFSRFMRR